MATMGTTSDRVTAASTHWATTSLIFLRFSSADGAKGFAEILASPAGRGAGDEGDASGPLCNMVVPRKALTLTLSQRERGLITKLSQRERGRINTDMPFHQVLNPELYPDL